METKARAVNLIRCMYLEGKLKKSEQKCETGIDNYRTMQRRQRERVHMGLQRNLSVAHFLRPNLPLSEFSRWKEKRDDDKSGEDVQQQCI